MRRKPKWTLAVSLMLVLSLFLAACSGGGGGTSSGGGDTGGDDGNAGGDSGGEKQLAAEQVIHLYASSDIPSIDSSKATDTTSFAVLDRVKTGLVSIYNQEVVPDMAVEIPEPTNNGTVYTFKIREDAVWSNGDPVTAQDFVFAWRRALMPETASQYAYIFDAANIKNAAKIIDPDSELYGKVEKLGVKAIDDKTLQVTLESPTPYFVSLMSFGTFAPINKEFYEKQGANYAKEPENVLYNGAYVLAEWNHGEGWVLEKNEKYWNADSVNIEKVTYKIVKSPTTALNLYKAGELDYVGLTSEHVDQYKNSPEFHQIPGNCIFWWKLNANKVPEFQNENLRKAISIVINREAAVNVLLKNGSIPAGFVVPKQFAKGPNGEWFREGVEQPYLPFGDVEKAKELWNKAKQELGIQKLDLQYLTTDGELAGKLAEYFADQIEQLEGITVTIKKLPWNAYLEADSKGNYEIGAGSGWCPDYKDPMTFLGYWHSDNPNNTTGLKMEEYDKLIDKARSLGTNPEKRWEVMRQAEKVLIENAYAIPTYQNGSAILLKPYIEGVVFQNFGIEMYLREAKVYEH